MEQQRTYVPYTQWKEPSIQREYTQETPLLDDSGKLTGLEEQIEALKTSKPNLFPTDDGDGGRKKTPGGTGKTGGSEKFEQVKSKEDFLKLSTADQIKFKEAHPDVFKSYLAQ